MRFISLFGRTARNMKMMPGKSAIHPQRVFSNAPVSRPLIDRSVRREVDLTRRSKSLKHADPVDVPATWTGIARFAVDALV